MTEPIRVVHVLSKMDKAGAETLVMNLYRNIDKSRFQFDFVVHTDEVGYFDNEIKRMGGKIHHTFKYRGKNHLNYKKWWDDFFKSHKYSLVHCHIRSTANIILNMAKKHDITTIAHSHSSSNGTGVSSLVKNFNQKFINRHCDYRLACSKEAGQFLFGKNKAFEILKNGIPTQDFLFAEEIRENYRAKNNLLSKKVYCHVGRFDKPKNHSFLIKTFSKIKEYDVDAHLLLIGNGELKVKIAEKVAQANLTDSVSFLGKRSNIPEIMMGSDVFLLPSLYEGLPLVLVEAQATGIPCAISNTISGEAIINKNVFTCRLNDSSEYAKAAAKMIELPNAELREQANKSVVDAGYDIRNSVLRLEEIYSSLKA